MIRNTVFIVLTSNILMKIITFLINLEDNHPNSEVRLIAPVKLRQTLHVWLNEIKLNLNIKIEYPNIENELDTFNRNCYELYLLDKLIENNNVVIIDDCPFMQMALPLDKFNKDFGGLEIKDGIYSPELVYFTNASLVKEIINKARETYNEICLPTIKNICALIIQKKWFLYKKKFFNKNIIESELKNVRSNYKKLAGLKYEIEDNNKYTLDKLDYDVSIRAESIWYKNEINVDLIKKEEGLVTYKGNVCSLFNMPVAREELNPQCQSFVGNYTHLIIESRNNIRNYFSLWNSEPVDIKWCLSSFMNFSARDEYLNNFLVLSKNPPIYRIRHNHAPYIMLGVDNIYIYNYPTSAQFTPYLLGSYLLILAYPMKAEDINILDECSVPYYNLNMNLPQSITKIIEVQKINLKKENEIYSLGSHKSLIFKDRDREKKEYTEYLKKVSSSKYMIVYNDYKYNKCTQITEALAFGTIPILLKENNIIINNDNFKEGIHYILADTTDMENKVASISDEEYGRLKQNCLDFYNKYESEKVFNKKLIRFILSKYQNFRKFGSV